MTSPLTPDGKLRVCAKTRAMAGRALSDALAELRGVGAPLLEAALRDAWLSEMRCDPAVYPDGWYTPPPHGISVLFASDADGERARVNFESLRTEGNWPRADALLDASHGIAYAYASPVDRATGLIGDFGCTLYLGKDPLIRAHLRNVHGLVHDIFSKVEEGMTLGALFAHATALMEKRGLVNRVTSTTDTLASTDIGHTVPASYEEWSPAERAALRSGDWARAKDVISKKRVFVNPVATLPIRPGMAFTIEPRLCDPQNPHAPLASFHTICLVYENGEKQLLSGFDDVFTVAGMRWMRD